jgi:hypothetical protein
MAKDLLDARELEAARTLLAEKMSESWCNGILDPDEGGSPGDGFEERLDDFLKDSALEGIKALNHMSEKEIQTLMKKLGLTYDELIEFLDPSRANIDDPLLGESRSSRDRRSSDREPPEFDVD